MDGSQITGTASSYARKYALNGLFCIDDTKDADTDEYEQQQRKSENSEKVITKTMADALSKSIDNAKIPDEIVELILSQYGYTSTSEIKVKDYTQIVNDLKSRKD